MVKQTLIQEEKKSFGASPLLFNVRVTSSQKFILQTPSLLDDYIDREKFFEEYPFSRLLIKKGLPSKTLVSMMNCGNYTGQAFEDKCGCGKVVRYIRHKCSSRVCPTCSLRRKRKLVSKYERALRHLCRARGSLFLRLFTISPKNYKTLEEGFKHVRKSIQKMRRQEYFKKRLRGGIYVIEAKSLNKDGEKKGWNIHVHMIVYSTEMKNKMQGHCMCCGGIKSLNHHPDISLYSCVKCFSLVTPFKGDSPLTMKVKKAFKRELTTDISKVRSNVGSLDYCLKYISSNKNAFATDEDFADYIVFTANKKLVSVFGSLHSKIKYYTKRIEPFVCKKCFLPKTSSLLLDPPPIPDELRIP